VPASLSCELAGHAQSPAEVDPTEGVEAPVGHAEHVAELVEEEYVP